LDPARSIRYTRKQLVAALASFLVVGMAAGAQQRTEKKTPGASVSATRQDEVARISDAALSALWSGDV